jgi:hypothetical protein
MFKWASVKYRVCTCLNIHICAPQCNKMLVMESILRDRLGHFKLDKDKYNTHFYKLTHDYALAQKGRLRESGASSGEELARVKKIKK